MIHFLISNRRNVLLERTGGALLAIIIACTPAAALPHLTVDLDSGKVLSHQQAFDPWHPASLTKLMTAYTVFRAIEQGEINGNHTVRVSKNARRQPPSRMGYRTGTKLTMENALKLLLVKSANDISVAIAESVSGSVDRFSSKMNREAARLGMNGSRFVNPHGLHDRRQVTTARDMGILVRAIHQEFPQYKSMFETPSVMAPARTKKGKTIQRIYYSYNLLLERFRGGDGFKTGFVCASGYNFIGSASRSGRRIAAIVLGRDSQTSRAVDAAKLIEEGFRQPITHGSQITQLKRDGSVPSGPRNMRNIMCSQKARASRYEPGAGQAVIDSPWLQKRIVDKSPLVVVLGSSGATTLPAARIPLPSFRPVTGLRSGISLSGKTPTTVAQNQPKVEASVQTAPTRNLRITLPTFRPGTL